MQCDHFTLTEEKLDLLVKQTPIYGEFYFYHYFSPHAEK